MKAIINLVEKEFTVERNAYLKVNGTVDTNVYYIKSGTLRVFVLDNEQDQIIRFGYPGNLVVALDSFFTGKPSELFIQAIKKSEIGLIRKSQIEEFLKDDGNRMIWIGILESLVVQQLEREVDILTGSPAERYLRVKKRTPQLFQEIPNKHIANYLRMSPETFSRLKMR